MNGPDRQAFEALQRGFVARLPGRMAQILGPQPQVRDAALHQLAGAAGAYGFDALGEAARRAQAALHSGEQACVQARMDALSAQAGALHVEI